MIVEIISELPKGSRLRVGIPRPPDVGWPAQLKLEAGASASKSGRFNRLP